MTRNRQYMKFWMPFGYHRILNDRYLMAWRRHDNAYGMWGLPHVKSRKQADDILREKLKKQGANVIFRNAVYMGVRTFGWIFYQKVKIEKND